MNYTYNIFLVNGWPLVWFVVVEQDPQRLIARLCRKDAPHDQIVTFLDVYHCSKNHKQNLTLAYLWILVFKLHDSNLTQETKAPDELPVLKRNLHVAV